MSFYEFTNPWKLTPAECKAMDAMIKFGSVKLAALSLKLSPSTVQNHCQTAGGKMGFSSSYLTKYLMWDRFRRGAA